MRKLVLPILALAMAVVAIPAMSTAQADDGLTDVHARTLRLYWAFFDRAPETEGAEFWITEVSRCQSLVWVSSHFAVSDEFVATYGGNISDDQFVEIVYANVLDRAPEPAGKAYWLGEMDAGRKTRVQVMMDFAWADEFVAKRPFPSDGIADKPCDPSAPAFTYPTTTETTDGSGGATVPPGSGLPTLPGLTLPPGSGLTLPPGGGLTLPPGGGLTLPPGGGLTLPPGGGL